MRRNFECKFKLKCRQSGQGSYQIPVDLELPQKSDLIPDDNLGSDELLGGFKRFFELSVSMVANARVEDFRETFPERSNAKRVIEAIDALSPVDNGKFTIRRSSGKLPTLLDFDRDRSNLAKISKEFRDAPNETLQPQELTVIARVEAVDIVGGTYRARTVDGLSFSGQIDRDFDEGALSYDPNLIEVNGVFEVDEDEQLHALKEVKHNRRVNLEPIEITELNVNNELLKADPPLKYAVDFLDSDSCYVLDGDLGLSLFAFSRNELESVLIESLQSWWLNYAIEDESKLSPSAMRIRATLLNRFSRTK